MTSPDYYAPRHRPTIVTAGDLNELFGNLGVMLTPRGVVQLLLHWHLYDTGERAPWGMPIDGDRVLVPVVTARTSADHPGMGITFTGRPCRAAEQHQGGQDAGVEFMRLLGFPIRITGGT